MDRRERVMRQIRGQAVDRVPLMGGWFHGVDNLAALAGVSAERYLESPVENLARANLALDVDCMIEPIVPTYRGEIRTGEVLDARHAETTAEDLLRDGEAVPPTEANVLAAYDAAAEERKYREYFRRWTNALNPLILVPNFWDSVPDFHLFDRYGYNAYFSAIALYPEAVGRIFWKMAVEARARNTIILRLIRELELPPMLFTGSDICNTRGPMVSIAFLRQHYFPHERFALQPLVEAGIRVIRHCDGNVMPVVDDFITIGYSGFQGFQYECGVDPYQLAARRSSRGERPLFFAGLNVTRTLPFGTQEDVRREVEYVFDFTDGGAGLFFFTSSSIGPEVPLANVRAGYQYAAAGAGGEARAKHARWPGGARDAVL